MNKNELQRISSLKTASDVLAVVYIPLEKSDFYFSGINIVLDDVKDPGNLGTIIRICDWFGVKNIYCSQETVDVYNPKVVQSTMGSITRVDVFFPVIFAPILFKQRMRSVTSGSCAALLIVVIPLAREAAIMIFSVAVTEIRSKLI